MFFGVCAYRGMKYFDGNARYIGYSLGDIVKLISAEPFRKERVLDNRLSLARLFVVVRHFLETSYHFSVWDIITL